MRVTVLYAGLSAPHAGWAAIDELAELFAAFFRAERLSPRELETNWSNRILHAGRRFAPVSSRGGDLLLVVARNPGDLAMVDAIRDCRRNFGRICGFVTDSYFTQGYPDATAMFDAITVTAHEDVAWPEKHYGINVHQLYQGADCLAWAPRQRHAREIDLIGFGRMPASYHACFVNAFHRPDSRHLYLHSPLGNLTGDKVHAERAMLFKLLHRSRISLAFHLFVEPQGERPRSMMVTSRWLESLLAGCVVAGRRPVSKMADDMLCWPGATVELSTDPLAALDEINALLSDNDRLEHQRNRNMAEMIARHDWRYRIADFCRMMQLDLPAALAEELERLESLHTTVMASC